MHRVVRNVLYSAQASGSGGLMASEPDAVIGTYKPTLSPQALFWGAIGVGSAVLVVVEGIERT